MHFRVGFTLISTFLFTSAVLANLSRGHHSSPFLDVVERDSIDAVSSAGARWDEPYRTFHNVTGTFVVPYISGPIGSGIMISVDLDGGPVVLCGSNILVVLYCSVTENGPTYTAAARWPPSRQDVYFTDVEFSYGDRVRFTLCMVNCTSSYATAENMSKNSTVQVLYLDSRVVFCEERAGWMVRQMGNIGLANFDMVEFTQPVAYGRYNKKFTPAGSSVYDITKDGQSLTTVRAYEDKIIVVKRPV